MRIVHDNSPRPSVIRLAEHDLEVLNPPADFEHPIDPNDYFSLTAAPNTRLGRRGADTDDITAPMALRRLRYPFVLCEVTVSIDFEADWDQGGLVIFAGGHPTFNPRQTASRAQRGPYIVVDPSLHRGPEKWARVALELMAGELHVSTLVANRKCGADWASTPALLNSHTRHALVTSTRLKLERVGFDLWIWYMVQDVQSSDSTAPSPEVVSRQWRKCREVINFFDREVTKGGVWVGCYASRPIEADRSDDRHPGNGLFAEFEDLTIL